MDFILRLPSVLVHALVTAILLLASGIPVALFMPFALPLNLVAIFVLRFPARLNKGGPLITWSLGVVLALVSFVHYVSHHPSIADQRTIDGGALNGCCISDPKDAYWLGIPLYIAVIGTTFRWLWIAADAMIGLNAIGCDVSKNFGNIRGVWSKTGASLGAIYFITISPFIVEGIHQSSPEVWGVISISTAGPARMLLHMAPQFIRDLLAPASAGQITNLFISCIIDGLIFYAIGYCYDWVKTRRIDATVPPNLH